MLVIPCRHSLSVYACPESCFSPSLAACVAKKKTTNTTGQQCSVSAYVPSGKRDHIEGNGEEDSEARAAEEAYRASSTRGSGRVDAAAAAAAVSTATDTATDTAETADEVVSPENTLDFVVTVKYVRREIRALTDRDREMFFNAVAVMQRVPSALGRQVYGVKYFSKDYFNRMHLYYGERLCVCVCVFVFTAVRLIYFFRAVSGAVIHQRGR